MKKTDNNATHQTPAATSGFTAYDRDMIAAPYRKRLVALKERAKNWNREEHPNQCADWQAAYTFVIEELANLLKEINLIAAKDSDKEKFYSLYNYVLQIMEAGDCVVFETTHPILDSLKKGEAEKTSAIPQKDTGNTISTTPKTAINPAKSTPKNSNPK